MRTHRWVVSAMETGLQLGGRRSTPTSMPGTWRNRRALHGGESLVSVVVVGVAVIRCSASTSSQIITGTEKAWLAVSARRSRICKRSICLATAVATTSAGLISGTGDTTIAGDTAPLDTPPFTDHSMRETECSGRAYCEGIHEARPSTPSRICSLKRRLGTAPYPTAMAP